MLSFGNPAQVTGQHDVLNGIPLKQQIPFSLVLKNYASPHSLTLTGRTASTIFLLCTWFGVAGFPSIPSK